MALTQRSRISLAALRDPSRFPKSDYIEHLYRVILQREPDTNGLQGYSCREDTQNFFREILGSREFKEISRNTAYFTGRSIDRPRILLFGAYGNGNLGDAIQAISLLRIIRSIRQDLEIWACSQLPCQFPFPFEYVLPSKHIYNVSLLNQFDLMILGGGGLLSHPHDPLTSEEWQRSIDVPVALFGIGAEGEVAHECKTLITKALYVSGRDESSLRALRRFRSDVHFVPDPVLSDPHYCSWGTTKSNYLTVDRNKLWIIKNAPNVHTSEFTRLINANEDQICFIEPFLDFPLLDIFPTARPIYFVDDLISLIDQSAAVVSMRYHGCILALLRNKPVVGLFEQKSLDLFIRYNLARFFCADGTTVPGPAGFRRPRSKLLADREIFRAVLTNVLSLIPVPN